MPGPASRPTTDRRRVRGAATVAAAGDGVVAVALPLLATAVTRDPLAVAGVVAAQHLPWIVVPLVWPRLRGDRRTVVGGVDTLRAVVVGLLAALTVIGRETILGIQLVALVIGLGEALTDRAETEVHDTTSVSARGMLGLAVVGLPLGGVLYEVFPATPFVFDVLAFAVAGLLSLFAVGMAAPVAEVEPPPDRPVPASSHWITASAAVAAAGTTGLAGVLVLFALDDLGLGAPAFGALLAGIAAATAVGGFVAPEVGRLLGLRGGVTTGLVLAGLCQAAAAAVADPAAPYLSALVLGAAAGGAMVAAVLTRAWLQLTSGRPASEPNLRGFHLVVWSSAPAGALVAGWLGRRQGVADAVLATGGLLVLAGVIAVLAPTRKSIDAVPEPVVGWSVAPNSSGSRTPEEV